MHAAKPRIAWNCLGLVANSKSSPIPAAQRIWAFIMVLASFRHMFVRPVLTMDRRTCSRNLRCLAVRPPAIPRTYGVPQDQSLSAHDISHSVADGCLADRLSFSTVVGGARRRVHQVLI